MWLQVTAAVYSTNDEVHHYYCNVVLDPETGMRTKLSVLALNGLRDIKSHVLYQDNIHCEFHNIDKPHMLTIFDTTLGLHQEHYRQYALPTSRSWHSILFNESAVSMILAKQTVLRAAHTKRVFSI